EADALLRQAEAWRQTEVRAARSADAIVCVSDDEASFFRDAGAVDIRVVTPWLRQASLTDGALDGRADIGLVAGWLAGDGSPNADALAWLMADVMPHILAAMPWARVRVTGHLPASLRRFEGPHLRHEGFVADLAGFYRQIRVAVAPLRFGAGVKLKTLEAIQHGVPIVATPVGAEGLTSWAADVVDVHAAPEAFAAAVVALLLDPGRWRTRRRAIEQALASAPPQVTWGGLLAGPDAGEGDVVRTL
ncbi:MAG TPA: glycosyltransferase family 4 protein, partial [Luteitalea sp.]|nr:glycosyltransferase family 4 protein [Luteitalea sp.]